MFVNHGNAFDEAVYQYGLVKGVAFASNCDAKAIKECLGDRDEKFIDTITEEMAITSFDDEAIASAYSQAQNAWDVYRSGIYNGLKAIIDPANFATWLRLCGETY